MGAGMRFKLPFPPSANRYYRSVVVGGHCRSILSAAGRQYKAGTVLAHGEPLDGPVSVAMHFYFPNKRGDLDNRVKPVLDALEGVAYENDRQVVRYVAERYTDKNDPRVEVSVMAWGTDES